MLLQKLKKTRTARNRLLISITFQGSPGPIRLIVGEDELAVGVIKKALKSYCKQGRFPVLGSDSNDFALYSPIQGLDPWMTVGSVGCRSFVLCKKPKMEKKVAGGATEDKVINPKQILRTKKGRSAWTWLNSKVSAI